MGSDEEKENMSDAIEDVCEGMMYASLAITDDKEATLKKVGKANPWHIEALRVITGSEDQAHKPLSEILSEDMHLTLDHIIDISGVTKGGHFLDTQGYIAHSDDRIVLSYRCTTSAFDWLTNLNTTSSAWEIEEDLAQGFSGYCSGFEGLCCYDQYKPRVHTGFYNNFLASLPVIKEYIEPLLAPDQPPRKFYCVGHSLGAGIATLAGCYFLLEFDWTSLPHTLVSVTAGSPRACCESMKALVDERRTQMGSCARFYRVVKGRDVVVSVPPKSFGFRHLVDPVHIDENGEILWNDHTEEPDDVEDSELKNLSRDINVEDNDNADDDDADDNKAGGSQSKYERMVAKIPPVLRDHMPDFYLKPLLKAKGIEYGTRRQVPPVVEEEELPVDTDKNDDDEHQEEMKKQEEVDASAKDSTKKIRKFWRPKLCRSRKKKEKVSPA
jgi:predicted lipase